MKIKEIVVGQSLNWLILGAEGWNKIVLTAEIGENEDEHEAVDALFLKLETMHKKHLPAVVEPATVSPRKLQPDKAIREKFAKAVAAQDLPTQTYLETIYQF